MISVPGPRAATAGMFAYDTLVGVYLAWVGMTTPLVGPLLWPAAVLHLGIAVSFATLRRRSGRSANEKGGAPRLS